MSKKLSHEKIWFTTIKIRLKDGNEEWRFWEGAFKFKMPKLNNLVSLSINTGGLTNNNDLLMKK